MGYAGKNCIFNCNCVFFGSFVRLKIRGGDICSKPLKIISAIIYLYKLGLYVYDYEG